MAKANLFPDLKEFLESLNSAGIKYMVVGGYAVNYHGYHRATDDLDVWIAVDKENARLISRVMQDFAGFPRSKVPPSMFLEVGKVFIFGREPVRIDILTGPSGVDFAECHARCVRATLDGVIVPLISLDDLKLNKRASGRLKDLADLENLPDTGLAVKKSKRKRR